MKRSNHSQVTFRIGFACLIMLASTARAELVPLLLQIDTTRSSLTWAPVFSLGSLQIPVFEQSPGSLTAPVSGFLTSAFDPVIDQLQVDSSSVFQFAYRSDLLPTVGQQSTLGGSFSLPGILQGNISVRSSGFRTRFRFDEFNPDDIAIGQSGLLGPVLSLNEIATTIDYAVTGLITANGFAPVNLPYGQGVRSGSFIRTGDDTVQLTLNINEVADLGTFFIGSVPVVGQVTITGTVIANATFIPEASTFALISLVGLGLIANGTRNRWLQR